MNYFIFLRYYCILTPFNIRLYMFHLSSHLDDAHRRVQIQYAKMDFIEMPRLLDQIR